jgi:hypothetical protein
VFACIGTGFCEENVLVPLRYPQQSNAPKRREAVLEPQIVSGSINVNVSGMLKNAEKSKDLLVEYFLDNKLIHSSRETGSLGFQFDSRAYTDGEHVLVVNLWDETGSSAIGMKRVIIKNE